MSKKDWFDDFMDYKLSTESTKKPPDSKGCLTSVFLILGVLFVVLRIF